MTDPDDAQALARKQDIQIKSLLDKASDLMDEASQGWSAALARAEKAEAEAAALREAAQDIVDTDFPTQRRYVQMQKRLATALGKEPADAE